MVVTWVEGILWFFNPKSDCCFQPPYSLYLPPTLLATYWCLWYSTCLNVVKHYSGVCIHLAKLWKIHTRA
jgi:hypothetical protein